MIGELLHLQIVRDRLQHVRHGGLDAAGDLERRSTAVFENAQEGAANPILPDDILLGHIPVANLGDVMDTNDRPIRSGFNRHLVQPFHQAWAGVEVNGILVGADFGRAAGKYQILGGERRDHVLLRKVLGFERFGIQIHRDHPLLAAEGVRNSHAGNADESHADRIHGDVEGLLLGKSRNADAIL